MGRDKALLPHPTTGQPLLRRQLDLIATVNPASRLVSAREGQELPLLPSDVIRMNDDGSSGPLAGIIAALKVWQGEHLLIVAVDLPQLTTTVLEQLLARDLDRDCGVYAETPLGPEPLVSIVPATLLPKLAAHLASGDRSPRRLFTGPLASQMSSVFFEDTSPFRNWNKPDDI